MLEQDQRPPAVGAKIPNDAAVPLAQIHRLLAADEDGFTTALAEIDHSLKRQISDQQRRRRRVANRR